MYGSFRLFNHFAARMIVAFVIVILIPAVFTSASFYVVSTNTVKDNVREASIQIAKQAADSISFILNAGSDISDLIFSDLHIQEFVVSDADTNKDMTVWREREENLSSFLNNMVYTSSFVNIVYVLKQDNNSWGSGTFSKIKLSRYNLDSLDWAKSAVEASGGLVWLGLQEDQFSGGGDNTDMVLPIARVLKDFESMENIGYILVNLNGRKMIDTIERMKLGQTGGFIVVNEEGRIMVAPGTDRINHYVENADLLGNIIGHNKVEFEYVQDGVPYYGVKQRLSNGWLIVGTVPISEITDRLDTLHANILLSFIIFTLVGIMIGLIIASRVTRPIKQLTSQMKLVQQGDLSVRTHIHSTDEIGLMSHQFNRMIADIDRLMEQVALEQKQKQEAEIRAVKHRINPHFLFNTLNTLRWLIKYDQSDKAYEGMSALLRLLEANMGKKGTFVSIEMELDIIEKYMAILELRYSNTFQLHVSLDPRAAAFQIPQMLIQPLVENAVFHGIVPNGTTGLIEIAVVQVQAAVVITVKDNGRGLAPGSELIVQSIRDAVHAGKTGIGLQHVYESIALYYDVGSKVEFIHQLEEGTMIQLTLIPKPFSQGGDPHAANHDRG
jgi:two-component system, sensor histidine kinase YesM